MFWWTTSWFAHLFSWPILHQHCLGVMLWSQDQLVFGDFIAAGRVVKANGAATRPLEEMGTCHSCGERLTNWAMIPGWGAPPGVTLH